MAEWVHGKRRHATATHTTTQGSKHSMYHKVLSVAINQGKELTHEILPSQGS